MSRRADKSHAYANRRQQIQDVADLDISKVAGVRGVTVRVAGPLDEATHRLAESFQNCDDYSIWWTRHTYDVAASLATYVDTITIAGKIREVPNESAAILRQTSRRGAGQTWVVYGWMGIVQYHILTKR